MFCNICVIVVWKHITMYNNVNVILAGIEVDMLLINRSISFGMCKFYRFVMLN